MERRCPSPSQGGVGVPQHPAVAQCPPHVRAGSDQHCSTPTAPHQVLHHHLQVSAHWAQSEYHHSLCDNAPVTQTPVDKLLSSNSRDNASQQFMLNCIADVDLPWVYNNTISDVNLCLQEYGEYRLWKDPGVCVWDNQAPKLLFDSGKKSKSLWNHFIVACTPAHTLSHGAHVGNASLSLGCIIS